MAFWLHFDASIVDIGNTVKPFNESGQSAGFSNHSDEDFLREALSLAARAWEAGEVPVGAVLVRDGTIVGRGFNSAIALSDPTAHAEILAIREAAALVGNYRLDGMTLYVTLEPCAMCAGALVQARIDRVVFGCRDLRFGAVRSKFRLADSELLNHRVAVSEGICGAECQELLQRFFQDRRKHADIAATET